MTHLSKIQNKFLFTTLLQNYTHNITQNYTYYTLNISHRTEINEIKH